MGMQIPFHSIQMNPIWSIRLMRKSYKWHRNLDTKLQ